MLRTSSRSDSVTVFNDWNGLTLFRVIIHGDVSLVVGPKVGAPNPDDYDNIDDLLVQIRSWALLPN